MREFAHFFAIYSGWIAIPCLAIIGIVYWLKQKTIESFILTYGIVILALGSLMQVFSPFLKMTMDEIGNVVSSSGPPLIWYAGSIIGSFGLVVTVIGFALVTWKVNKN